MINLESVETIKLPPELRVIKTLMDLAKNCRVSQRSTEVAQYVDMSEATVRRYYHKFQYAGLVRITKKYIILNPFIFDGNWIAQSAWKKYEEEQKPF